MAAKRPLPPRPLPRWLVPLASIVVAFHLFAIVIWALAAQSGPWPAPPPFGSSPVVGPVFATRIAEVTTQYYLQPLQMMHNYHFLGNRPDPTQIVFEARLKDEQGRLMDTIRFPSPRDNPWLRQRHMLMAAQLGDDEPVQPPAAEQIAGPGHKARTEKIWDTVAPFKTTVKDVEQHLIPKGVPVYKPREWALITARSYARALMQQHGAASVELTRESRPAIVPALLFLEQPPPDTFKTLVSTFEEYRREN
jgi:hypothetical protein